MFSYNRTLDLEAVGLGMFLLPYQVDALEHLYVAGMANSKQLWLHVNRPGAPDPKSRASVINFMNALADAGLVGFTEASGKGGYHRVYAPLVLYPTMGDLGRHLVDLLLHKIERDFGVLVSAKWVDD